MTVSNDPLVASICDIVQQNCTISDAKYAQHYSLCVYLLRMRDFYQWRFNVPLHESLNAKLVGTWIGETESQWSDMEKCDFRPISIKSEQFDPFDTQSINRYLNEFGLVYSAGIGRLGQPHFLIAQLNHATRHTNQYSINTNCFDCGAELARDSINMPAMAQGNDIYIRRDSIKRLLWQMINEWRLQKTTGPVQRLMDHYNWQADQKDDASTESIVDDLSEVVLNHELGEVSAGQILGTAYGDMVNAYVGKPSELLLRSVRDIVADTLCTLPAIRQSQSGHQLDFWLANVKGIREKWLTDTGLLLALKDAYISANLNVIAKPNVSANADANYAELFDLLGPLCQSEKMRWTNVSKTLVERFQFQGTSMDVSSIIDQALLDYSVDSAS